MRRAEVIDSLVGRKTTLTKKTCSIHGKMIKMLPALSFTIKIVVFNRKKPDITMQIDKKVSSNLTQFFSAAGCSAISL